MKFLGQVHRMDSDGCGEHGPTCRSNGKIPAYGRDRHTKPDIPMMFFITKFQKQKIE